MAKKSELTEKEKAALLQERQKHRQLFRRRIVGAAVVFFATFLLWEVGGVLPPQEALKEVPPLRSVELEPAEIEIDAPDIAAPQPLTREEEENEAFSSDYAMPADAPDIAEEEAAETAAPAAAAEDAAEKDSLMQVVQETQQGAAVEETPPPDSSAAPAEKPTAPEAAPAPETKPAAAAGKYVVQLGAFSRQQNAEKLAADVRKQGFSVQLEEVKQSGKVLWRVRVVNFSTRADAKRARQQLAELGHKEAKVLLSSKTTGIDTARRLPLAA